MSDIDEKTIKFLTLVPGAGWRANNRANSIPTVWNEQVRAALSDQLIAIGFGGAVRLTDAGRLALKTAEGEQK